MNSFFKYSLSIKYLFMKYINDLKISLKSSDLSKLSKIESNRKIYNILHEELKNEIHSLQILII